MFDCAFCANTEGSSFCTLAGASLVFSSTFFGSRIFGRLAICCCAIWYTFALVLAVLALLAVLAFCSRSVRVTRGGGTGVGVGATVADATSGGGAFVVVAMLVAMVVVGAIVCVEAGAGGELDAASCRMS